MFDEFFYLTKKFLKFLNSTRYSILHLKHLFDSVVKLEGIQNNFFFSIRIYRK